MPPLPEMVCPACQCRMPMEAWLGHAGAREAILALAQVAPGERRLAWSALRYAGLFAPAKQAMRFDRLAALLAELGELIASGRVEWEGVRHAAPVALWVEGMEEMIARRHAGALRVPLGNHNYLRAVVAGLAEGAAARSEARTEAARQSGARIERAEAAAEEPPFAAPPAEAEPPRQPMPEAVARALRDFARRKTT